MIPATILVPSLAFLSGWELAVVGVIALLVFGKRLPEVARSLGKGVSEFKKGIRDIEDDVDLESTRKLPHEPVASQPPVATKEPVAVPATQEPAATSESEAAAAKPS
ncbi:MAG: Sec-independent protein translocase subunit TatA/TatB [Planctomycetota bacterium]|jgi:sec-independent protein translocase protein TatA